MGKTLKQYVMDIYTQSSNTYNVGMSLDDKEKNSRATAERLLSVVNSYLNQNPDGEIAVIKVLTDVIRECGKDVKTFKDKKYLGMADYIGVWIKTALTWTKFVVISSLKESNPEVKVRSIGPNDSNLESWDVAIVIFSKDERADTVLPFGELEQIFPDVTDGLKKRFQSVFEIKSEVKRRIIESDELKSGNSRSIYNSGTAGGASASVGTGKVYDSKPITGAKKKSDNSTDTAVSTTDNGRIMYGNSRTDDIASVGKNEIGEYRIFNAPSNTVNNSNSVKRSAADRIWPGSFLDESDDDPGDFYTEPSQGDKGFGNIDWDVFASI